jgi:hypothetical protein
MRKENFGQFLNAWGINSAGFNESVLKFVEKDGKLIPSVVPWNRIICDQIDFASNPKIELLELTESQLRKNKSYDQELVDKLCDALASRETVAKEKKDNKNNYIKLYEIHGELPLSYLTGKEEDEDEYQQQMHVISFVVSNEKGRWDDFTLFSGKEAKDPYMLTALLPEIDGSIALRGSVKGLFDAQWMQNHTIKTIKDQLDLASKLIFQTSDATFVGQNALSAIQNGDILIHKVNEPLTELNNTSHDITALQNFGIQWKQLGNELSGISESMLGQTPPSGTAWRQVNQLLQENHSLFELMTENRGLDIERMLREHIIPFLKKQLGNNKQIAAELKAHQITQLDARYIKNFAVQQANKQIKERILNGESVTTEDQANITQQQAGVAQDALQTQGNQRYFAPDEVDWKVQLKDLEWEAAVDVTNEDLDPEAAKTLQFLLQFFQGKQGQPMTPEEEFVVGKILRLTGTVSAIEMASMPKSPPPQAPQNKVSESISFKDLPFEGQQQMAQQAGIKITQPKPEPQPAQPVQGASSMAGNKPQPKTK